MNNSQKGLLILLSAISLLTVLACNATFTVGYPTPTVPPPTAAPTSTPVPLSEQVRLVSVPFIETNQGGDFPPYTLTASTPHLDGSDDPRVTALNQRLSEVVQREVEMWRKSFQELRITPLSNGSSLEVTYILISRIGDLWSFKFDIYFYADTAAHPGQNSLTLNYDLAQGRELALADLFLPGSDYLQAISDYCTAELRKQPYAESFSLDGAGPSMENYLDWNIVQDGLQVNFEMYQVAPGASGPITILVPWSQLSTQVDPQGPLAGHIQ